MWAKLSILMITAFVDVMGMLMIVPLLPYYARSLGANGVMVVFLIAVFVAAQVLSAPFWGRVSDRYGRRPTLLIGLAMAASAYLVFAYATSFWLLVLSRIIQGTGSGTTGVIQAYVGDTIVPHARVKALGWLSAATSMGSALGPPIGALALRQFGRSGPGFVAAVLCMTNIIFAWWYLQESSEQRDSSATKQTVGVSKQAIRYLFVHRHEAAPRLIWMYALAMGAFQGSMAILALYLNDRFGIGAHDIWIVFTFIGAISVLSRASFLGWFVDRYGEQTVSRVGLVTLAVGLLALPLMPNYVALAGAVALLPLGIACIFPCVTSLLMHVTSSRERGLYLGIQQMCGGCAVVVVQLWSGVAYDHLGHRTPFWTSAVLVGSVLMLWKNYQDSSISPNAVQEPRSTPAMFKHSSQESKPRLDTALQREWSPLPNPPPIASVPGGNDW